MEDRETDYQARQTQDSQNKIIVHENLTQTRANMIKQLGQMREKGFIVNYHTKTRAAAGGHQRGPTTVGSSRSV